MIRIRSRIPSLLFALPAMLSHGMVAAQVDAASSYPNRAIHLLVGFAPGGGADVTARLMAQKFGDAWGQSVIVENRTGAGGNIATGRIAKAAPNGYNLIMVTSGHAISVSLYDKLSYDPVKDVAPISLVAGTPSLITVHPSVPVSSVRELIAFAKTKPGGITYGSPGTGTTAHLATVLLAMTTGIRLTHVPYKGSGASTVAALAGQIQALVSSLPSALPHVRAGKLRVIGVTSGQRTQLAADMPTIAEGGVPGYEANTWYGMLASPGTPAPIINKINAEIGRVNQQRDVLEKYKSLGFDPLHNSPAQFTEYIKAEITKWEKVVRKSGAKAD